MKPAPKSFLLLSMVVSAFVLVTRALAHGDLHERIVMVTAQIKDAPTNAMLYLERAELHRNHREFPQALADLDQAEKLKAHVPFNFLRGRTLFEADDSKAALPWLDKHLAKSTNDSAAFATRARARAQLGDHRGAAEDFTRAIATTPTGQPELYLERATALTAGGQREEALRGLDEGIYRIGPLITLQLQAIDLEVSLKRHDAALKRLDSVMARSQRKETWLTRRGTILAASGRAKEAAVSYRDALAALDKLPPTHRNTRAMIELEASIRSALREHEGAK